MVHKIINGKFYNVKVNKGERQQRDNLKKNLQFSIEEFVLVDLLKYNCIIHTS